MKGGNAALVEASCQRCIHHHMVAWGLLFPLASLMFGTHSLPMRQKWPGVAHLTWVVKMRSRSGGISHILFACNINPTLPPGKGIGGATLDLVPSSLTAKSNQTSTSSKLSLLYSRLSGELAACVLLSPLQLAD